jgi:hypothetical protein
VPNPARPDLSADPRPTPGSHRDRSKELPTTRPAHTKRTERFHALRHRLMRRRVTRTRLTRPLGHAVARPTRQMLRRLLIAVMCSAALLVVFATPAFAATTTLSGVIDNLRNWIVGILTGVATLFLTIGGLRYLTAGGDPGQVEKAKIALKSAAIGYALAILAPLMVSILASIVGGG